MNLIHRTAIPIGIIAALTGIVGAVPAQATPETRLASLSAEDYNQAASTRPQSAEDYYSKGLALHDRGDIQGAIQNYTKAIQMDPKYVDAYLSRGLARSESGRAKRSNSGLHASSAS